MNKYMYMIEDEFGDIATDFVWFEEVKYKVPEDAKKAMKNTVLFPKSRLIRVQVTNASILKNCNGCGIFLPKGRWMNMNSYVFEEGYRPVCDNCEEIVR